MKEKSRFWIQEYNEAGDNWIDYVGFSPDMTYNQAKKRLDGVQKSFQKRTFRLIARFDVVVAE